MFKSLIIFAKIISETLFCQISDIISKVIRIWKGDVVRNIADHWNRIYVQDTVILRDFIEVNMCISFSKVKSHVSHLNETKAKELICICI